ncbi:MAG: H-NS histone family protein [Pseudomonadota bacterium]|nr:H-NS histone family protein [Pseudomonadota bacterium]
MAKSYIDIMKQIDVLKGEAEKLRSEEIEGVKARIREAIGFYDLTAADLGLSVRGGPKKGLATGTSAKQAVRKTRKTHKLSQAAKFRDEVSGGTWVGRGKRPQWLRDALAGGKSLDDYRVR